jgi:zinc protease
MQDEPVRPQELDAARRFLTGTLPLRLETNNGLVRQILEIELYSLGWDYIQRYPEIVNSLTVEDVQRVARTYLHSDRFILAIAGPTVPAAPAPDDAAPPG